MLVLFFAESASLLLVLAFAGVLVVAVQAAVRVDAASRHLVGLGLALTAAALLALSAWAVSVPGSYFSASLLLPLVWFVLAIVWTGWVIYIAALHRLAFSRREVVRLLWAPLLGVIAVAVVESGVAFDARYAASKGAMNTVAREISAGSRSPQGIQRIGLWDVEKVERVRGGMRFLVDGTGFLDPVGFAYSPRGKPPIIGEDFYEHLDGPWWIWTESW